LFSSRAPRTTNSRCRVVEFGEDGEAYVVVAA
jgi:hypothetical protein